MSICYADKYNNMVQNGINDLKTLMPDVAKLLKFKENASKYKAGTHKKDWFICPNCGTELYKEIKDVATNGLRCNKCSDGFSYPEKFMKSLLEQLEIDFTQQFSPNWLKPYRYDFYFEKDNKKYIIEMDGGLGHGNLTINGKIDINGKKIDEYKDSLAKEYDIRVIRINCFYNYLSERFKLIRQNIINSPLSTILDIEVVDFSKCNLYAEGSIFIETCKLVNNGMRNFNKIANELHISTSCVRRYIKDACDSGYLNFEYKYLKSQSSSIDKIKSVATKK